MVLIILLLLSSFHIGNSFTLTKFCRSLSGYISATTKEDDIDFQSIYNIDEKYSQEEALKIGRVLTEAIRQVKVDHEKEIESIEQEIRQLQKKRSYTFLAYWCFDQYVKEGKLNSVFEVPTENISKEMMKGFDCELMNTCLAKYGMLCDEVTDTYNDYDYYEQRKRERGVEWRVACSFDLSEEDIEKIAADIIEEQRVGAGSS